MVVVEGVFEGGELFASSSSKLSASLPFFVAYQWEREGL
jgi:hypothetical protein